MVTIKEMITVYDRRFYYWNKDFDIEKGSADEMISNIKEGNIELPEHRREEVLRWLEKFIRVLEIAQE